MRKLGVILATVVITIGTFIGCENKNLTEVEGYFWKATKEGKEIYLGGTMHPSPIEVNYLNEKFNNIINDTDAIAVEIDISDNEKIKLIQEKSSKLLYQEEYRLEKELKRKELEKLKQIYKDLGIDYKTTTGLTPYGVQMFIENAIMQKINFSGESCDSIWAKEYKAKKKIVSELESVDFQISLIEKTYTLERLKDLLNKEENNNILESSSKVIKELFNAFKDGDLIYPKEHLEKIKSEDEDNYNRLIVERNKKITNDIEKYIESDKKYFVTAGYLHFIGDDSILEVLRNKGYQIGKL